MVFRRGRQTDDAHQERPPIQPVVIDVVARADLTPVSQWVEGGPIPARPMPPGPTSALFAGVCRYYHDCFSADSRGGIAQQRPRQEPGRIPRLRRWRRTAHHRPGLPHGGAAEPRRHRAERRRRQSPREVPDLGLGLPRRARTPNVGRKKGDLYCAPLLFWPARIEQEGSRAYPQHRSGGAAYQLPAARLADRLRERGAGAGLRRGDPERRCPPRPST